MFRVSENSLFEEKLNINLKKKWVKEDLMPGLKYLIDGLIQEELHNLCAFKTVIN